MKKIKKDKEGKVLEIIEYDEKGNLIHIKNSDGYEEFIEYKD